MENEKDNNVFSPVCPCVSVRVCTIGSIRSEKNFCPQSLFFIFYNFFLFQIDLIVGAIIGPFTFWPVTQTENRSHTRYFQEQIQHKQPEGGEQGSTSRKEPAGCSVGDHSEG